MEANPLAQQKHRYQQKIPDSPGLMIGKFDQLCKEIKTEAARLGFNHMGIAPAFPVPHKDSYRQWIKAGNHANMDYLARADTLAKRGDPAKILEDCQRIICLAMFYHPPRIQISDLTEGKGRIASYAVTEDYHDVIWEKLSILENFIIQKVGQNVRLKSYVDTGPILERSYASLAGIGIAGKNSCLLIQGSGSYFFLAEILTDLALPVDKPFTTDLCKSCQRCIEACPTGCILPNRTIDARRCISYLTIEHKSIIPDDVKKDLGDWIFGCDICQIVCPHNAISPPGACVLGEPIISTSINLTDLFSYEEDAFQKKFGQTPLTRPKRRGILRNAAIALGNQKFFPALPVLEKALAQEQDPIVQDACRWAIDQIKHSSKPVSKP